MLEIRESTYCCHSIDREMSSYGDLIPFITFLFMNIYICIYMLMVKIEFSRPDVILP